MVKTAAALILLVLSLAGCASHQFCAVSTQTDHTAQDAKVVSPQLGRWMVAHNEKGAALCGWKP